MHPTPGQPTDAQTAECARLRARHDELVNMDEDEWTDELVEEGDTIETRLAEIEAAVGARAVYRPDDIAIAGCIATVGSDGTLQLVQGLVRPEDMPAKDTATTGTTGRDAVDAGNHNGSGVDAPTFSGPAMPPARPDAETQARKEAGVGIGLADDLRAIRTALVKAHLAEDFPAAFDLMLFQMGRAVFIPGYHDHALDIAVRETPDRPPLRVNDDAFAQASPGEAMLADRSSLPFDWLEIEDGEKAFAALRALSHGDKKRLFAACAARTLKGQLAFEPDARPELEATVARLDIDFAAHVRPGAEIYWSRVRKDRLLDIARETLGIEWAHTHRKDKKATLATAMETAFAAGDGVPLGVTKGGRAAALDWAPPGFAAFDTGSVDDAGADTPPSGDADDVTSGETATEPAPDMADDVPARDAPPVDAAETATTGDSATEPSGAAADDTSARVPSPVAIDPGPDDPPRRTSVTDSTVSPGVAEREALAQARREEIDAMNAVPTVDGGPRVIIQTVGLEDDDGAASTEDAPPAAAVPGNGHDGGGDALEIPAFLRR